MLQMCTYSAKLHMLNTTHIKIFKTWTQVTCSYV